MMLTASKVQEMLGVENRQVIAYGYTFERRTVEIFFYDGRLFRHVDHKHEWNSEDFEPSMFSKDIKRFYRNGVHPRLIDLFEAFGDGLPITDGGREWGYIVDDEAPSSSELYGQGGYYDQTRL